MAQPKNKFYGSISLDGIKQAVTQVPAKVTSHEKYGKEVKITAAQWDDDAISLQVYDAESKTAINIGRIMISKLDGASSSTPVDVDNLGF